MSEAADRDLLEHNSVHDGPEQSLEWLTFAGNDERKLLILLALDSANEPLGRSALYHELQARSAPYGIQGDLSAPFQFCGKSLARIGAVESAETIALMFGERPVTASGFAITSQGHEFGVPFAGALLDWSARHRELSLSEVFGNTASKSGTGAPLTRYAVLHDLAAAPDSPEGPSVQYLAGHLAVSSETRQRTVDRLEGNGIVTVESTRRDNKRRFRITNPNYVEDRHHRSFDRLKPASKIIFNGLQAASQIKDVWGKDEFLNLLVALNPEIDEATVSTVRQRFAEALDPEPTYLKRNIERLDGRLYEAHSKVTIAPDKRQAVKELITVIDALCGNDQNTIDVAREKADEIFSDSEEVASLWKKAFESSNHAIHDEHFRQRIVQLVHAAGKSATVDSVRLSYHTETGRNIARQTMQKWLDRLVANGMLAVETSPPRTKLKRELTNHYSVSRES